VTRVVSALLVIVLLWSSIHIPAQAEAAALASDQTLQFYLKTIFSQELPSVEATDGKGNYHGSVLQNIINAEVQDTATKKRLLAKVADLMHEHPYLTIGTITAIVTIVALSIVLPLALQNNGSNSLTTAQQQQLLNTYLLQRTPPPAQSVVPRPVSLPAEPSPGGPPT